MLDVRCSTFIFFYSITSFPCVSALCERPFIPLSPAALEDGRDAEFFCHRRTQTHTDIKISPGDLPGENMSPAARETTANEKNTV